MYFLQKMGQAILPLFFTLVTSEAFSQSTSFLIFENEASTRPALAKYWASDTLSEKLALSEWAHQRTEYGQIWEQSPTTTWLLTHSRQGYLTGNPNTLSLASRNALNLSLDLSTIGSFSLNAEAWSLQGNTLSLRKILMTDALGQLTFVPHVIQIKDYQHITANGQLTTDKANTQLQGIIHRLGTRFYGILENDQPDNGWGTGLHVLWKTKAPAGEIRGEIFNLFSHLHFNTIHYSTRQYNVNIQSGEIQISDIPSLQGVYGLKKENEKLPKTWRLELEPAAFPSWTVGLTGLENHSRWTAGYTNSGAQHTVRLRTVAAQYWQASLDWHLTPCARLGATVGTSSTSFKGSIAGLAFDYRW